jgi:hypothetical protein
MVVIHLADLRALVQLSENATQDAPIACPPEARQLINQQENIMSLQDKLDAFKALTI